MHEVRDTFMSLATYSVAYFRNRQVLSWILTPGSDVAFADDIVCWNLVKGL